MDFSMSTSCTIKSIARHMKTGSGYDRTFPDCVMTFVFSLGRDPREFRQSEIAKLDQEMGSMIEDVDKVISDYKVTSAERYKHINNETLMLGQCDSDSHTPLLVYVRSLAADQERNLHRKKEFIQNKKKEKETAWKSWDQSYKQGWKPIRQQLPLVLAETMVLLLQSTLRAFTRNRHYEFQLILLHIENMPASDQ